MTDVLNMCLVDVTNACMGPLIGEAERVAIPTSLHGAPQEQALANSSSTDQYSEVAQGLGTHEMDDLGKGSL